MKFLEQYHKILSSLPGSYVAFPMHLYLLLLMDHDVLFTNGQWQLIKPTNTQAQYQ